MKGAIPKGRRLALDPGGERIGLAISDELGLIATPLRTIESSKLDMELSNIIQESNIGVIYIGLPIHLSGAEGNSALAARELAQHIAKTFPVPISLVDERLTSKSASHDQERIKRYGIDAVAACEILNFALTGEKSLGKIFGSVIEV